MKDLQDDMGVVKKEKRRKFAIDPTEGQPKDYCKDDFDWTKKDCVVGPKLNWSTISSNDTHKANLWASLADIKPLQLWLQSESSASQAMAENDGQEMSLKESPSIHEARMSFNEELAENDVKNVIEGAALQSKRRVCHSQ